LPSGAYLSAYHNVLFCIYDVGAIRDVSEFQPGIAEIRGNIDALRAAAAIIESSDPSSQ
jgi:hypothetical protein